MIAGNRVLADLERQLRAHRALRAKLAESAKRTRELWTHLPPELRGRALARRIERIVKNADFGRHA